MARACALVLVACMVAGCVLVVINPTLLDSDDRPLRVLIKKLSEAKE